MSHFIVDSSSCPPNINFIYINLLIDSGNSTTIFSSIAQEFGFSSVKLLIIGYLPIISYLLLDALRLDYRSYPCNI